jgi:hypothetical protein
MGAPAPDFESKDLAFGSAVGEGVQELLVSGDINKAMLKAFMAWNLDLFFGMDMFEDDPKKKKHHKKSFPYVIKALKDFLPYLWTLSNEWELLYFDHQGKTIPAVELSAVVVFPDGFRYRLFIDAVLRHKETNKLLVVELKTTGAKWIHEAQYANSNQALSYSIILDKIAPGNASYIVWYFVYCSELEKWEPMDFAKSKLDKANWVRTVLFDFRRIRDCIDNNFFPKQGENCMQFGRPCQYFGACDMSKESLYAGIGVLQEKVEKELATPYHFQFTIEEIIDQQLEDIDG